MIGRIAAMLCVAGLAGNPARAGEAPDDAVARAVARVDEVSAEAVPLPRARAGRITSYAAFGALAAGGLALATSFPLRTYDFRGVWYEKWRYDRAFLRREAAADPLLFAGIGVAGAHVPLLVAGALTEGVALRQVTHVPTAFGWTAVGLLAGGASLAGVGFAVPWVGGVLGVTGGVLGVSAWVLALTQFGVDVVAERRLSEAQRERIRRPRVEVSAVPLLERDRLGLAVVGTFR